LTAWPITRGTPHQDIVLDLTPHQREDGCQDARLRPGQEAEHNRWDGRDERTDAGDEAHLEQLEADVTSGRVSEWLHEPVRHLAVVLRRLSGGLYHCYDVPGLPRTDNALEQFYRRVKTEQRRITGRKRADAFVVRVGGFAVYATASSSTTETVLSASS
jgi:hypothetical protein